MSPAPTRRPVLESFGATGAIQVLNAFTGILLARELAVEGRGELAAVLLLPAVLAALGSIGVGEAATYAAARPGARLGVLAGSLLVVAGVQSAVVVGVGAVVMPVVLAGYDGGVVTAAYAYLAYIPLFLVSAYALALLQGARRLRTFQALRLGLIVATAAGLGALAAAGGLTVGSAVAAYLCAYALLTVSAVTALVRVGLRPFALDRDTVRGLLRYGVRAHGSTVANMASERLDQLLIAVFLGPVKLGLYVVAVTMTSAMAVVGSSVALVATPQLAAEDESSERVRLAARAVRITLVVAAALALPLVLAMPAAIEVLFGSAFAASADVARILAAAAAVLTVGRSLAGVLKGLGHPGAAARADGLGAAVTVVALAFCLPAFGLVGAGIASVVAYLVATALLARSAAARLGMATTTLLLGVRGAARPAPVSPLLGD